MKSLILVATLSIPTLSTSYACDEMETAKVVVDHVCNYSLVSNSQCRVWQEDMRQMTYNNRIIIDSFIGWNSYSEKANNDLAKN